MTEPNLDKLDIQAFLESICRGNYDEDGVCLWDLAELRDGIEALIANQVREARLEELTISRDRFVPGWEKDWFNDRIKELGE